MSRTSWSEDWGDDFPGQVELFQANVRRSMRGKAGQAALRELEAALLALPDKELYAHLFAEPSGAVCALGAVAVARREAQGASRVDALASCSEVDPYDSEEEGQALGFPRLVAQAVVWENDAANDHVWEGGKLRKVTPRERYDAMLAWVRARLVQEPGR